MRVYGEGTWCSAGEIKSRKAAGHDEISSKVSKRKELMIFFLDNATVSEKNTQ